MTCEVCDREGCPTLAPGRRFCSRAAEDCAAHAVNWRDLAIAGRTREAALTAEVERLATTKADDEQRAANALMVLTVDLGLPMPLADETWVAFAERIRGAVAAVKSDLAAARADAANARQIATEACDGWSAAERAHADTVEGEGYEFDRAGAEKPIATLRARLASPEPGADGAKET